MKCPKCGYLGFEHVERCRNCGYDFSLTSPAKLPELPLHDGSNNWARLSGDLELLGSLAAELRLASVKWESVDEGISNQLRQLANEDAEHESELRKLAMKCDAMALD